MSTSNCKFKTLTFVADGPIYRDSNGDYYEYSFHKLLQRYSMLAEKINFLIRVSPWDDKRKYDRVPDEISVYEVPNTKGVQYYFENHGAADSIIESVVKQSDCLVLRIPGSIPNAAYRYINKYSKPWMIELCACPWDSYWNHSALGKIVAPYMYLSTRKLVKNADWVSYVTESFLQRRYPFKEGAHTLSCSNVEICAVPDDVLDTRISNIRSKNKLSSPLIVGTAATLDVRYKGQEHVIRAIPLLEKMGISIEYHLAGGFNRDPEDVYLINLVRDLGLTDKVKILGSLSSSEMLDYYDSLDIYIQPSKQEGLPRSVIEAMSRGVPCLGTNIAGIPELLPQECLFKKGSDNAVAEAIYRLSDCDLTKYAEANFYRARHYQHDVLSEMRKEFYSSFLSACCMQS